MLFVLFFLFSVVLTDTTIPACNGTLTFNPPQNTSIDTWYPYNYSGNSLPQFPKDYECNLKINVPQGWYARIVLRVYSDTNGTVAPVQIIDQMGKTEEVFSMSENIFFSANYGTIKLSTGNSQTEFGFLVQWQKYPSSQRNITHLSPSDQNPFFPINIFNTVLKIKAETRVSASITTPPSIIYDLVLQHLRGLMFFDGESVNATFLGTGLQLLNAKTQLVSSGNFMTIIYLGIPGTYDYVATLFQDYENTKEIVEFQSYLYGYNQWEYIVFPMNATNGRSAVQTVSTWLYRDIVTLLEGTGKLNVYQGGATKSQANLVTSYSAENCSQYLPQIFFGSVKTYVLNSGVATMNVTQNQYSAYRQTNTFGRKGFIRSQDFGVLSTNQDLLIRMDKPENSNSSMFRFSIQYADLAQNVTLEVTNRANGKETTITYSNSNLPKINQTNDIYGEMFFVEHKSNRVPNKGFLLNYEILEASDSRAFSIYLILVFMGIMIMG